MNRPNNYRQTARTAEHYFPVRIRVARNRLGYDRHYLDMCRWLDASIGPDRWWHGMLEACRNADKIVRELGVA